MSSPPWKRASRSHEEPSLMDADVEIGGRQSRLPSYDSETADRDATKYTKGGSLELPPKYMAALSQAQPYLPRKNIMIIIATLSTFLLAFSLLTSGSHTAHPLANRTRPPPANMMTMDSHVKAQSVENTRSRPSNLPGNVQGWSEVAESQMSNQMPDGNVPLPPSNARKQESAEGSRTEELDQYGDRRTDGTGAGVWPANLIDGGTTELCDICDCEIQPGIYSPKPWATHYRPRPKPEDVVRLDGTLNRDEYLRQSIQDIYCSRQHMSTSQTRRIVRRTSSHLDQMMSWNISGLDFNRPTIYLTTNTSPNGKGGDLRPQYFRRHARTIQNWMEHQASLPKASPFQILWVIVEDELDIDPAIISTMRRIGVPYVYYAYGPTNGLGHAQRNAALQLIYTMTRARERGGLFGHGPVYCLDDDNKMAPQLLDLIAPVQRIGVFPMGNFGVRGGYEVPVISPIGEVMGSNSPWPNRTFPFDNGGFAFNSQQMGKQITGPTFWKWNKYGGESEFIAQIVSDVRHIEPLCGIDPAQPCRFAWHNEPLVPLEKMTDKAEDEFLAKNGRDVWLGKMREELEARVRQRGY